VERCINLARQLLALARSTSELPQGSLCAVDLAALACHAVEEALPQAQARHIDLGIPGSQRVTVTGDELALQVLVRNLLDNAIKYSQPFGRVDVIVGDDDSPQLIVSDAGPGVSPAEQARLFDRFYRGANPDVEGTGLGLAIVKEIAERHGARIELKSPGTLGGLDVVVRFPRSSAAVAEEDNSTAA
jgi:two-component system, OmpR family, sensor kinase